MTFKRDKSFSSRQKLMPSLRCFCNHGQLQMEVAPALMTFLLVLAAQDGGSASSPLKFPLGCSKPKGRQRFLRIPFLETPISQQGLRQSRAHDGELAPLATRVSTGWGSSLIAGRKPE